MPKSVVKKKRKVPSHSSDPSAAKNPGLGLPEQGPAPSTASAGEGANWSLRFRIVVVVLAALIYGYLHSGHRFSFTSLSLSEPTPPEWGPSLALDKIGHFSVPQDTLDFCVQPNGDAIVVGPIGLSYYSGGKLIRSANLPPAGNRSVACDGSHIFVTGSGASIARFNMDLSPNGSLGIKNENQILGIAWSPKFKALFASGIHSDLLYELSPEGKLIQKWNFGYPADGRLYLDILVSPNLIASCDVSTRTIELLKVNPSGELEKAGELDVVYSLFVGPAPDLRVALLGGDLYIPSQVAAGNVMVLNTKGHPQGYLRAPGVTYARAGEDGFLYLFENGTIKQYKAL